MGYKPSRYNFFFDADDGTHLAFNAMSGGFAKLEDRHYHKVQKIIKNPNSTLNNDEERKLKDSLLRGRFLIEEGIDELELLKVRNWVARFSQKTYGIVVSIAVAVRLAVQARQRHKSVSSSG